MYRCISNREIGNLYKGNQERKAPLYGKNTYHYDQKKSYIHFFKFYEFAELYKKRSLKEANSKDRYVLVMAAYLPDHILQNNLGYGFYSKIEKRIQCPICLIPEYRIETQNFKREYIVEVSDVIKDENRNRKKEYDSYIHLINRLGEKYGYDYTKILKVLEETGLDKLLKDEEDQTAIYYKEKRKVKNY